MDSNKLINPHDKFFREALGRKDMALGFVEEYLPPEIRKVLDLKSLEIVKDSYIDKELSEHFSDILYRINIDGKQSFVYLLFEHKSYLDRLVPFQLLRNMVKIWEQFLKQNRRAKKLPIIVPLIIYHGQKKWRLRNDFSSLFEKVGGTDEYIPDFRSELFDISHTSDERIKGALQTRAFLLLLKHILDPRLLESHPEIMGFVVELTKDKRAMEYLEVFIRHVVSTVERSKSKDLKRAILKTLGN
jgi:predicted transposase/invertase (TIGR01784 family)